MGSFVGCKREDVYTDQVMAQIKADPINFRPPGYEIDGSACAQGESVVSQEGQGARGESQMDVENRVTSFVESLLEIPVEEAETITSTGTGVAESTSLGSSTGTGVDTTASAVRVGETEVYTVGLFMHALAIQCFIRGKCPLKFAVVW